ncbi:MAG: heavy metal-binding domain-containing protein [Candidatus Obscuribacterales bacterium]|nr:heavy metal-binding domain-containing protein [Candidatus Obscuribacterales bacterium]
MPFWRKETDEEKQEKARQEATLQALERGELPPIARERIERERAYGKSFFSSDLTSREFLLTREAGFQPLGQVMGTSFFKIGFWGAFNKYQTLTDELPHVTAAISKARKTAINRLKQEAQLLGASGVIGVHVKMKRHEWASNMTEFTAYGTAIRIPDWPADEEPFTSSLNGQEFWQLYKAGYLPRSLVMGACAFYMHMNSNVRQVCYGWFSPNQELSSYTLGYQAAAQRARFRMQEEIAALHADGAVGVRIDPGLETIKWEMNDTEYTDLLLNFVILGTAVSAHPQKEQTHPAPLLCLNLRNKSYERISPYDMNANNYWEAQGENLLDDFGDE